nr:hypothetical protein [Tanacetum cinerariifolium]
AGTCVSAKDATTTIPVNAPLDDDEPAEESSFLRRFTRKKSVAKKRSTPPSSSLPFSCSLWLGDHSYSSLSWWNSKDLHYFEGNSSHGGYTDSYKAVWQVKGYDDWSKKLSGFIHQYLIGQAGYNTDKQVSSSPSMVTSQGLDDDVAASFQRSRIQQHMLMLKRERHTKHQDSRIKKA